MVILAVSLALSLSAVTVQAAGRAVDNPTPMYKGAAENDGVTGGGYVYIGRPNDNRYVERPRTEGNAEFAVMDVHDEADGGTKAVYHGRPMDNPNLIH